MDTPPIPELERLKDRHPDKFLPEDRVFSHVRRGDRIFIGTACGEPQHLVHALTNWVRVNPKALFDAEIVQVWTLGVAPYTDEKLKYNFRHNSFFLGNTTRGAVNAGLADYTPIFLSQVPDLFNRGIPCDLFFHAGGQGIVNGGYRPACRYEFPAPAKQPGRHQA